MILNPEQTTGHIVSLLRTDPRHLEGSVKQTAKVEDPVQSFGELLARALGSVNALQVQSAELSRQAITDPESVDIHDVTIALAEANLSLSMTKSIFDKAIQAYRETISIR